MIPVSLWILLAASMMTLGGLLSYGGHKLFEAGETQFGTSLILLGLVFLIWGSVVLSRCRGTSGMLQGSFRSIHKSQVASVEDGQGAI